MKIIMPIVIIYEPTLSDWIILFVGVFIIFLVAFLFTKYTKYGGGSDYGITDEFNDFDGNIDV